MLTTKALSSFKGIFPSIHQPLPLDKRASQQLLDTLTTSFRRQLDLAHGWSPDTEDASVLKTAQAALTYLPHMPPTKPLKKPQHRRPTDQHLRAILNNPLFSHQIKTDAELEKNRDELFDQAVARGLMTIRRAHGFLLAVQNDIKQSPTSSLRDGMSASGAGLRVLRWLRASGKERDLSFLSNRKFTTVLTRFLFAEGMGGLVWEWCVQLAGEKHTSDARLPEDLAHLFKDAAQAESQSMELDGAFSMILSGEKMLQQSGFPLDNLMPAWRSLSWKATVESWKHSAPSEQLFDSFVSIPDHVSKPLRIERAHLDLHHPSSPDPTRAMAFLTDAGKWGKFLQQPLIRRSDRSQGSQGQMVYDFTTKVMAMGLDTVQLLLQVGKPDEAERILDILRSHLGSYFEEFAPRSVF